MNKQKILAYLLLIISILALIYALVFSPPVWIVLFIAIVFIPFFILSFGLLTMAKAEKEDKEGRVKEPFIGY